MPSRNEKDTRQYLLDYATQYIESIHLLIAESYGVKEAVPPIFGNKLININVYYSKDREHVLCVYNTSTQKTQSRKYYSSRGNVLDFIFPTRPPIESPKGFTAIDSRMYFTSGDIELMDLRGDVRIILENVMLRCSEPIHSTTFIEYGFVISIRAVREQSAKTRAQFDYLRWLNFFQTHGKRLSSQQDSSISKADLNHILINLEKLLQDESKLEQDFEKYLDENSIILQMVFDIPNIANTLKQQFLKNIVQEDYKQNLIPDLMYKDSGGQWCILDYKRSKKIMKNMGTARQSPLSDLADLITQLKEYRKYFNESIHREYFLNETGHKIFPSPRCKGLIGYLQNNDERRAFNNKTEDEPNWMQILSYNDLLEKFRIFVDCIS